ASEHLVLSARVCLAPLKMSSANETVTLRDAVLNVELLNEVLLPDDQPSIEAASKPLLCKADFDTNFTDRNAFITGVSKYMEEATRHAAFQNMLLEGLDHAGNLYTWRCCSRAVPMAKSNDQPNRGEINMTVMDVLRPEVDKLFRLMEFSLGSASRFCEEVHRLCHIEKRKDFVSEAYLLILARLLNMFVVLDELKNMKASIKNDFSTYRRAVQALQGTTAPQALADLNQLSMFLAQQNNIKDQLKKEISLIDGHEELLADVINICAFMYENRLYLSPSEKHLFVKVMAFCVSIIDHEGAQMVKLDQKKRVSISRLDKIFKSVEVVPLYGDMQIQPFSFVKRSRFYEASKWQHSHQESDSCHVKIVDRLRSVRAEHESFVVQLAKVNNEVHLTDRVSSSQNDAQQVHLTSLALSGVQLLCSWTADVVETISWKLLHPTDSRETRDCPEDAEEYARATKYNYSPEEKSALVEMVSMIKAVQAFLTKIEPTLSYAVRRNVYAELQDFVQNGLSDPLHKAAKGKKDILQSILQSVRDCCLDSLSGSHADPRSSTEKMSKKSKKEFASSSDLRIPRRAVPPAPGTTQLYMARTQIEALVSEKISGGKKVLKKELEQKSVDRFKVFLVKSFHWPGLFNLLDTMNEACELSQLWFREFYLEMTMGKRIQFPIEMSMPWILTEHVLSMSDGSLLDSILYQLDLYNDAAQFALLKFRKQFLYDEVEAEVNLCFDQFVYKLSESVFTHFKQIASCMLLDKRFKSECQQVGVMIRTPPSFRFETLLAQRHVQLLGRSVDLNRLVSQRVNQTILKALDIAIWKFESEQLSSIIELDSLLEANRLAHSLLSEHLHSLSPFEDLFLEANHNVSQPHGRVTLHVFWELNYDFIPNFAYNGSTHRFVRPRHVFRHTPNRDKAPPVAFSYLWGSKSLNIAYANIFHAYEGFIGMPHLKAIARLLQYRGIAVILEELLKMAEAVINDKIRRHYREVLSLMPKVCKLPRTDYGSTGALQYYLHHLEQVGKYKDLKTEMCHEWRELGNILVLCMQIEIALAQEETLDLLLAAPFTNHIPQPPAKTLAEQEKALKRLEEKYSRIQLTKVVEQFGTPKQVEMARDAELMTKERLCCGLNIFEMFLVRIKDIIRRDQIWSGGHPLNGVMWIDECVELHRVWSAVQFYIAQPPAENEKLAEALFGDSLQWGVLTMIVLLGQHRRFEVLDFCYHLHRMQKTDGKDEDVSGIRLSSMVDRIRRLQLINNQILSILPNYLTSTDEFSEERVQEYLPPIHPNAQYHQE
ncbi:hypothetical protein PMAYCL1PPCAC_18546, partial [Pristionchus mayeri]